MRRQLARRTVRMRLTLLYGALFLLSGAALVGVTYALFERATEYTKPHLPTVPRPPAIGGLQSSTLGKTLPQLAHIAYQLNRDQHQLAVSAPGLAPPGHLTAELAPRWLAEDEQTLVHSQHQLARTVKQLAAAVRQVSHASVAQTAQRAADSHELLVSSGFALAIAAVLAVLAGWLVAGRMLAPLRTITRTAQRISSTSLRQRLALGGPQDELKELGDTLDELFGRLEAAFEAQRQFVANASHELRAPLTRQRALIQVALADPDASSDSLRMAHERVLASELHLEQMIDALLTLTRGQAGLERREPVDVAEIAARALLTRESQLAGLELGTERTLGSASTAGDPRLIERLVDNLLDNALRHNVPDGTVAIATGTRDGRAILTVINSGPAVPPEQLERLFEPFQRLGGRTAHAGGHGLGLSIVRAIADAHDAELSVTVRAAGGLAVVVSFPPAADALVEHEARIASASRSVAPAAAAS